MVSLCFNTEFVLTLLSIFISCNLLTLHLMLPVVPKYSHFKNSKALSCFCPWANSSPFLECFARHLDFFSFLSLTDYYLSFKIHFLKAYFLANQISESPDLSYMPPTLNAQSTLCLPQWQLLSHTVVLQYSWLTHVSLPTQCYGLSESWFSVYFLNLFISEA